jgi:hypothetical protein
MLRIKHRNYGNLLVEPIKNYFHSGYEFMTVILHTKISNAMQNPPNRNNVTKSNGHYAGTTFDIAICNIINSVEV